MRHGVARQRHSVRSLKQTRMALTTFPYLVVRPRTVFSSLFSLSLSPCDDAIVEKKTGAHVRLPSDSATAHVFLTSRWEAGGGETAPRQPSCVFVISLIS